ncbi:MAG: PDZ domain-containing protein [Acidobacteria bacterium]|nr:PDZ domain-containing protein [Acidobacteriota bacterium]
MFSSIRRVVLWVSAPVLAFALVGGFLGRVNAGEETFPHLRVFHDVVTLITDRYVEKTDPDKVMTGAMHGLADSLDPDSAFLSADLVKQIESSAAAAPGDVGIDFTRQYWLRIIATRDGSPAARAGLRTGDFVRLIGDTPTREMSVYEGMRRLRGAPGSKVTLTVIRGNTNDPHVVELTREAVPTVDVTGRMAASGVGLLRVAAFTSRTAAQAKAAAADLAKNGATKLIVDVRHTSGGSNDAGLALARLFVPSGTLAKREARGSEPTNIDAAAGDGSITMPVTILADNGTSGASEIFASALLGNKRAELIGEHTIGRAGEQKLVKLPDGTGLWLTSAKYLTPSGEPLHGKGLTPTVAVDAPDVEFGQAEPTEDAILDTALERLAGKKAA